MLKLELERLANMRNEQESKI